MKKKLFYIAGLIGIISVTVGIFFLPIPSMIKWQSEFLDHAFLWLLFSAVLCLYRLLKGPSASDRVVAIDMLGILIVGFCAVLAVPTGRDWYIDIGIAWALQSFIGIMAFAKHLEDKDFDE